MTEKTTNPYEYDCARCGIRVVWCTEPPPESLYCLECRFIEGIDDPKTKDDFAAFLKRPDGRIV